jgi:hypothetical protein
MLENNPPQHLFKDEVFGTAHIRKQDISYMLPTTIEGLEAVRELLAYQKWSGSTAEENEQIAGVVEIELSRRAVK